VKSVFARGPARLEAAMTPLIDMAMLLIVFFVLVSQIGVNDLVKMTLPKPVPSAAAAPGRESRGVINAISNGAGTVSAWRFASTDYAPDEIGMKSLSKAVADSLHAQPTLDIHLRADADLPYEAIAPAIESIGRAATLANPGTPARLRVAVQSENPRG